MKHLFPHIALLSLALLVGVFLFTRYYLAGELVDAREAIETLTHDLGSAREQLDAEMQRTTVAEREAGVMRQANTLLRESERQRQDEIARLQADLAFYRRLGGASGSQAALAIHHVELRPTTAPRVYQLAITLTQNLRWASAISGRVHLAIDGIQAGVARHLDESQLYPQSAGPLTFQFKYFQQLEGLLTLPAGFEATRMSIRLESSSLHTAVEQSLPWQSLFELSTDD